MSNTTRISTTIPREDAEYIRKIMREKRLPLNWAIHQIILDSQELDEKITKIFEK